MYLYIPASANYYVGYTHFISSILLAYLKYTLFVDDYSVDCLARACYYYHGYNIGVWLQLYSSLTTPESLGFVSKGQVYVTLSIHASSGVFVECACWFTER